MRREAKIATRVVSRALRVGGRGARSHLRKHMRASGLGRMSKVWRYKFYPGRRGPMSAAAFVYVRGRRAKEAVWAFENGAVIRPQRGRYLAIPTGYNKQGGYRKSKSGPLVTVEDMIAAKGMTFTKRTRNGLLWFMRVTTAQEKKKGRIRNLAYVGGDRLVGSGRVKRTKKILEDGAVPMFILTPSARIRKRTDIEGVRRHWENQLPGLIVQEWDREDRSG
jgi:hypothetical protein